jgi:hypothetical protein
VTKVAATGLRIPIAAGIWAALDFKQFADSALDVTIGCRSTRPSGLRGNMISIVPMAGNHVVVFLTFDATLQRCPFEVLPVNEPEERGRLVESLSQTSSGDPIGEMLFREVVASPIAAREFRVEFPGSGRLLIKFNQNGGDARVRVEIMTEFGSIPTTNVPTAMLSLFVKPQAADLVSVCLRGMHGVLISEGR